MDKSDNIDRIKSDCKKEFENRLISLRQELINCLGKVEVLDKDKLEDFLKTFNSRLVLFQKDYIDYIANKLGHSRTDTINYSYEAPDYSKVEGIASGILAACGAGILANIIPVATVTTGWIFTTTTSVGASTVIGGALGMTAGVATAGIGIIVGIGVGYLVNKKMKKSHEDEIRNKIICLFDGEVTDKLRKWTDEQINGAC